VRITVQFLLKTPVKPLGKRESCLELLIPAQKRETAEKPQSLGESGGTGAEIRGFDQELTRVTGNNGDKPSSNPT